MELLGKKRKGNDLVSTTELIQKLLTNSLSHLSLEDYSRQRKKCKEEAFVEDVASFKGVIDGVVTAPPCGGMRLDRPARGLKRKIGCIDAATRLGRKKKIEQDYCLGERIGQGKFGSVISCRSKVSRVKFACKTLRKGDEFVHREVEIMQHISGHPGVVTLKAVYEDAESFHLVMELCSGGRLLDQMARKGRYTEYEAAKLLKELMLVVKYCHVMGVVHRDIKPENILLTASGQIKLADFGLAKLGQSMTGVVGSPSYIAPEVLDGDYSEKVDIWGAGVLLYALFVGELPFQGTSLETVFEAVKKVNLDFSSGVWESVSQPARDLIAHMLTRDVSERFSAEEVLSHPWIMFNTESKPRSLTCKPKIKTRVQLASYPPAARASRLTERSNSCSPRSSINSRLISSFGDSTKKVEDDNDDEGAIDVLADAISRVRISSEPKRSRICTPSSPLPQEQSSNMTVNNLCTAF